MSSASRPVWTANLARPPQPERNRLILALAQVGELSFSGIGARAGCSRNAVAGVIDRARKSGRLGPAPGSAP